MTIITSPGPRASSTRHASPFDLVHRIEVNTSERGEFVEIEPDDLSSISVEALCPVRSKRSHVGAPNFSGKHFHSTLRRHVWFESRLEQAFVESTEADPSIIALAAQPMRLHWVDAAHKTHVPDYLVVHADGRRRIVNVRPAERVARSEDVFALVDAFAETIGVESEVFTGLDTTARDEASFLHRYRLGYPEARSREFGEPMTVWWAYEQHDPGLVRDMWVAVATGQLTAVEGDLLRDDCVLIPSADER